LAGGSGAWEVTFLNVKCKTLNVKCKRKEKKEGKKGAKILQENRELVAIITASTRTAIQNKGGK
jgi:hypothetical protein